MDMLMGLQSKMNEMDQFMSDTYNFDRFETNYMADAVNLLGSAKHKKSI